MALGTFGTVQIRTDEQAEKEKAQRRTRRVLMLAYFFPPDASGGVPRTVKFIKYLERLDWKCTVIAPAWDSDVLVGDPSGFGASIPSDTEIIRVGVGGSDHSSVWKAMRRLPLLWRIEGRTRRLSEFPDEFAAWLRAVLPAARRVLSTQRYDVIYSTSPPVTSHAIAMRLKAETGLPWVADFRDPWTDNSIAYGNPPQWRRQLDRRFERRICGTADRVIANTATNRAALLAKHGIAPERIVTITNGYDEEDFHGVDGHPPADRFRITYSGSFYAAYNPATFLLALKQFLAGEPGARVVLSLAGGACDWARQNISDPDLTSRLELLGQLPPREVYGLMAASHLLMLTLPRGSPHWIPGKLFEYLRSGTQIVAVCDRPSEVAALLENTARGHVFRPDETAALAGFLSAAYRRWRTGSPEPTGVVADDTIKIYERAVLSARLADIFEQIAESRH
jgi:glycosyltransferase involved in cell wall biosynthesis